MFDMTTYLLTKDNPGGATFPAYPVDAYTH